MKRAGFLGAVIASLSTACIGGGDETSRAQPRFSEINKTILADRCTVACHSGGEFAAGGLDLKETPYATLLDAAPTGVECAGSPLKRVAPGDPEASLLYLLIAAKVHGEAAPCGETMPLGAERAALTQAEVDRIRAWILAGAKND